MANHDILLSQASNQADMELGPMDEETLRKMSKEALRTRKPGVSLFRTPAAQAPVALDKKIRREAVAEPLNLSPPNPDRVWESLIPVQLDSARLAGNGVFSEAGQSEATGAFDILRTRILQAMQERGWHRIAVTSPTHGCGKSFVAANLALSLARRPSSRTVLVDLELRNPALAGLLGQRNVGALGDMLSGEQPLESHVLRAGRTLALALNSVPVPRAAEMLQEPSTAATLAALMAQLAPEIVVCDVPPALVSDDVLALLPQVDAVLLVADGTQTTAADIRACERLFAGHAPLMGVVLNRAQDRARHIYGRR